ncbi:MAG: hypothetical protein QMD36_04430 [Candidatus Aenigmarchaeota archaeon]|nr:hypothetical protein [Candidatus Aenigmarchaeota archaeon]
MSQNGIVHLWDFPKCIYIDVSPKLKSKILSEIRQRFGNHFKFVQETKRDYNRIYNFIHGHKASIEFVFSMIDKLGISKEELEKNVWKIGLDEKI